MTEFAWRRWLALLVFLALVIGGGIVTFFYYSVIFAETVDGRVVAVSRGHGGETDVFVVAVRGADGRIRSAEGSDPRWGLVAAGHCASARFFPAPPWNLELRGSYLRATLLNPRDCTPSDGAMPTPEESDAQLNVGDTLDRKVLDSLEVPRGPPEISGEAKESK